MLKALALMMVLLAGAQSDSIGPIEDGKQYSQFRQAKDAVKTITENVAFKIYKKFKSRTPEAEREWVVETQLAMETVDLDYPVTYQIFINQELQKQVAGDTFMVGTTIVTYTDEHGTINWQFDTVFEAGEMPRFFVDVKNLPGKKS